MATSMEPATAARTPPIPAARPPAEEGGAGISIGDLVRQGRAILFRHLINLGTCTLLSLLVALAVAQLLGEEVWEAKGKMTVKPLRLSDDQKPFYVASEIETLRDQAKTDPVMDAVLTETGLTMSRELLRRIIEVTIPEQTKNLDVTVKRSKGDEAAAIANSFMVNFEKQILNSRKALVTGSVEDTEASLNAVRKRFKEIEDQIGKLNRELKVGGVLTELATLREEIRKNEEEIDQARTTIQTKDNQIAKLETEIAEASKGGKGPAVDPLQEKEITTARGALDAAQAEKEELLQKLDRLPAYLRRQDNASQKDYDELQLKLKAVLKKIENAQKQLDLAVKGGTTAAAGGTGTSTNPVTERSKARLEKIKAETELPALEKRLQYRRARLALLESHEQEATNLEAQRKSADDERIRLERQQQSLKNLATNEQKEVYTISKATPGTYPAGSTTIRWFLIVFGSCMGLSVVGIGLYEAALRLPTGEELVRNLGLPVLTRPVTVGRHDLGPAGMEARASDDLRRLTLRVRQYLPETGAVLVVSSVNDGNEVEALLGDWSLNYAQRGERVLLLDARLDQGPGDVLSRLQAGSPRGPGTGLVPFLIGRQHDLAPSIAATAIPGVDLLAAGGPFYVPDVLASPRMKAVIDEARKRYTLILVCGPRVDSGVELEILAAYADGLLFTLGDPKRKPLPQARDALRSLQQLQAPILGAVVCVRPAAGTPIARKETVPTWKQK